MTVMSLVVTVAPHTGKIIKNGMEWQVRICAGEKTTFQKGGWYLKC